MTKIRINLDELIFALETHDLGDAYVDRETGEVIQLASGYMTGEEEDRDELAEQIEAHEDRYLYIEPISSSEGWQIMADFVESLPDGEARFELARALRGSHPFRRFKDTLLGYPTLREQWFEFHAETMRDYAREWLEDEAIDAELYESSADAPDTADLS